MKRASLSLGLLGTIAALNLSGCPANNNPANGGGAMVVNGPFSPSADLSWNGSIEADSITIPAGVTMNATGDLTLRSKGAIVIDGQLLAAGDAPRAALTLDADGDIVITGRVVAPNGGPGADGGALSIISNAGSILLLATSFISSGDGGPGVAPDISATLAGGAGGKGGDLILRAPNGSIQFAATPESIHLGNGGAGADIVVPRARQIEMGGALPAKFTNDGGESGHLEISATQAVGLLTQEKTLTANIAVNGEVLAAAGTTVQFLVPSQFTGGAGGRPGKASVGMDDAESNADEARAKRSLRLSDFDFPALVEARGANGKAATFSPANGADIELTGLNGANIGQCGQSVRVVGGDGGNCLTPTLLTFVPRIFIDCRSGDGGNARARGGVGAPGVEPGREGGCGGRAEAFGGPPGLASDEATRGCSGTALARGGRGGPGGNGCPANLATGGKGGDGGEARAKFAVNFFGCSRGPNFAQGGKGGDGGDGVTSGGEGGEGGRAFIQKGDIDVFGSDGEKGKKGATCPPAGVAGCGTPPGGFQDGPAKVPANGYAVARVAPDGGDLESRFPQNRMGLNDNKRSVLTYAQVDGSEGISGAVFNELFTRFLLSGANFATAINNDCKVVGEIAGAEPNTSQPYFAALSNAGLTDFKLIPRLGQSTKGTAADLSENNVAPLIYFTSGKARAAFYDGGEPKELPVADASAASFANGISRDGATIAGSQGNKAGIWSGSGFAMWSELPGLVPNGFGVANDVEGNRVVGAATNAAIVYQPVLWINGGAAINLNTVGADAGAANETNPAGVTVGLLRFGTALEAFVHTDADGTVRLNGKIDPAAGVVLLNATAINRAGEIACVAADQTGKQFVVILTPKP